MSANTKLTNHSVAERFVQTFKQQIRKAGKWPLPFQSMKQADSLLKEKIRSFNEEFKGATLKRLPLKKAERYAAIAARGAMNQEGVNDQIFNKLEDLKKTVHDLRQQLTPKSKRSARAELPLRDPASESVYDFLMCLKRAKYINRYIWARARIAITLLRFLGLSASDAASITLKDIESGLQHGSFQVFQPSHKKR